MRLYAVTIFLFMPFAGTDAAVVSGTVSQQAAPATPIAGAEVFLERLLGIPGVELIDSDVADGSGAYSVETTISGAYRLRVTADGYVQSTSNFSIDAAQNYPNTDILLSLVSTIELQINDAATLLPVEGAYVRLLGPSSRSSFTPADGHIVFPDLLPGDYKLCVIDASDDYRDRCYQNQLLTIGDDLSTVTPFSVNEGSSLQLVMNLTTGAVISGILTDSYTSAPIADTAARFSIYAVSGELLTQANVHTNESGEFRIGGLPDTDLRLAIGDFYATGSYYFNSKVYPDLPCTPSCNVLLGSVLTVQTASPLTSIDFSLFPGSILRGRVTSIDTGMGIAGVPVHTYTPGFFWQTARQVMTDGNGDYEIAGIFPGRFRLGTQAETLLINQGWPANNCYTNLCATGEDIFTSPDQFVEGYDFQLDEGLRIRGQVTDGASGLPVNATIRFYDQFGDSIASTSAPFATGDYDSPALPTGQIYYAVATRFNEQYAFHECQVYSGLGCDVFSPPVLDGVPLSRDRPGYIDLIDFNFVGQIFQSSFESL